MKKGSVIGKVKSMPIGIGILFFLSIIGLVLDLRSIVIGKPVFFDYFGTNFPKNFPLTWYFFNLVAAFFWIIIVWTRSRKGWQMYLILSIVLGLLSFINHIFYLVPKIYGKYPFFVWFIFGMYLIGGSILFYVYKQKKYFCK